MNPPQLQLEWLPGRYAVCRLEPLDIIPTWAQAGPERSAGPGQSAFLSITRTDQELSIVIDESLVPLNVKAERGFIAMRLVGVIDMSLIGIFARLTGALAAANVPVFVMSTFGTDYLMVREQYREAAVNALSNEVKFI